MPVTVDEQAAMDEDDRLFADDMANLIFCDVFNPADDSYMKERDSGRFRDCVARIVALGYSETAARYFMNENLSCCD